MSEETLFEKLGVKYIEKDGIWITYRRNIRNDTEVWYDLTNYMIKQPR